MLSALVAVAFVVGAAPTRGQPAPYAVADTTPVATIEDAIRMVRIEDRYGTNGRFAAFSPDGSKFATVVWYGDLERNVNVYDLLVFDVARALAEPRRTPPPVLSVTFEGDTADQAATPIDQLTFLGDERTIAFLGTLDGEPRQVYAVDIETGAVRALTRHPSAVLAYAVDPDGRVRVYAAAAPDAADSARIDRLHGDGVSPYDESLFGNEYPLSVLAAVLTKARQLEIPRFFVPDDLSAEPLRVTRADELQENLPPETLLEAQAWSPDGASVVLSASLLPDVEGDRSAPDDWVEVSVPSLARSPVPVPARWSPVRWDAGTGDLILRRGDSIAAMRRRDGVWTPPRTVGGGFNPERQVVTNGRIAIGVVDSLTVPPELAALDLATGETTILTDLNPELRDRRYGEVEQLRFSTRLDPVSTGWLIRPVGYEPGRRYPLVVLLANEPERPGDRSYLIDGRHNLSGHAAQPLAAEGFVVLYIGGPPSGDVAEHVRVNVEEAVRALGRRGLVDTLRVGVSGWSRSAWYTDHLLIHSTLPFAAATQIDGGTVDYGARLRPYTDEELSRIRAPLLLEHHGLLQFAYAGAMADRLRTMGKAVDVLYFESAPHSTKQPRHRWRSLTTHLDWWRFWLQDREDPDPAKAAQYRRWRALRESR